MKRVKTEVVTRYQIEFTPAETRILRAHPIWESLVSTKSSVHNGHGHNPVGRATLTKRQINDICDVLGVNGREWSAAHLTET